MNCVDLVLERIERRVEQRVSGEKGDKTFQI